MAQILQPQLPVVDRPLRLCHVCKKMGYLYRRQRGEHSYLYTIHKNEPPIGVYSNGQPKYRWCYDNGRLYETLEEAVQADKQQKRIKRARRTNATSTKPIHINCPKCHHRGRLNMYHTRGKVVFAIVHKKIPGRWGKTKTTAKRERCYVHVGPFLEELKKKWQMKKDQK